MSLPAIGSDVCAITDMVVSAQKALRMLDGEQSCNSAISMVAALNPVTHLREKWFFKNTYSTSPGECA